jgi:hypothetical protein
MRLAVSQRRFFSKQLEEQVEPSRSYADAIRVAESVFAVRIRELAEAELEARNGLIVVDGLDYEDVVQGRHFFLALAQTQSHGRLVGVIVEVDRMDPQLLDAERMVVELQRSQTMDRAAVFNNRPFEERYQRITEYSADIEAGKYADPSKLDLTHGDLVRVRIDVDSHLLYLR